jgi:hypothetical protein
VTSHERLILSGPYLGSFRGFFRFLPQGQSCGDDGRLQLLARADHESRPFDLLPIEAAARASAGRARPFALGGGIVGSLFGLAEAICGRILGILTHPALQRFDLAVGVAFLGIGSLAIWLMIGA